MRILHTADWHIGKTLYEYPLLEDQRAWFGRLYDFLAAERVELVLVAGDIYDRIIPSGAAVALLDEVLCHITQTLGIPVVLIAGNHDSAERLGFGRRLLAGAGAFVAAVPERDPTPLRFSDAYGALYVWPTPYADAAAVRALYPEEDVTGPGQAAAVLIGRAAARLDPDARNLALAHGFFMDTASDGLAGALDACSPAVFERFDYAALGHLHSAIPVGRETVRYAGSPIKYAVAEAGQQKAVTLLDLREKGRLEVTQHSIAATHDLRELTGRFDELCLPDAATEDYVFVNLTDDGEIFDAMGRLRELYPNILGLRLLRDRGGAQSRELARQLRGGDPVALFARFYEQIKGEPLPEHRRVIVAEALRAALRPTEGGGD